MKLPAKAVDYYWATLAITGLIAMTFLFMTTLSNVIWKEAYQYLFNACVFFVGLLIFWGVLALMYCLIQFIISILNDK